MSLNDKEKDLLLKLARETIMSHINGKPLPPLPKADGEFGEECGVFVTLHKGKRLRGCIGNMIGRGPLVETIQEMAIKASTKDPRFPPTTPEELKNIHIEISVLSPMKKITSVDEIIVGTHGIMMTKGWHRGVLLPQVATEQGWDRDTFLTHTCLKAGLPDNSWKDPETIIEIFSANVFGEDR